MESTLKKKKKSTERGDELIIWIRDDEPWEAL